MAGRRNRACQHCQRAHRPGYWTDCRSVDRRNPWLAPSLFKHSARAADCKQANWETHPHTSACAKSEHVERDCLRTRRGVRLALGSSSSLGKSKFEICNDKKNKLCKNAHLTSMTLKEHHMYFKKQSPMASVRERTIPSERSPLVGELSANLCGQRGVAWAARQIPYDRNLGFINRSPYYFSQVAPQLYSRGWADPVPDSVLLRKSGSAGNRTRTCGRY
jgi:hypothetical protein